MQTVTVDPKAVRLMVQIAHERRARNVDPVQIDGLEDELSRRIRFLKHGGQDDRARALRKIGRNAAELALRLES